jgi:hypothetical protein
MDTVATYTVSGGDGTTVNWSLGGADGSHFTLDGTDMSRMLKFKSAPDYEMPRGAAMSDTNTNTYMVTVKAEAGGEMEMVEVTVMVTNVDELGTLSGPARPGDYMENGTGAVATYTTSPDTATWSVEGDDGGDFTITGGTLEFSSPPNFEAHPENSMDTVATYTVSGGDGTTVNWSLGGADGSHFTLDGTDMSRMLKFKRRTPTPAPPTTRCRAALR